MGGRNSEENKEEEEKWDYKPDRVAKAGSAVEMTSEVEGINPEWNEMIDFRIGRHKADEPFEPQDVINSRNKVVITLYD